MTRITLSISPQTGCSGCSWSWAPGWTLRPGCWWWRWMSWRCAHPEPCPAWWWHVWYKCYLVTSSYQTMRILFSSNFSSKAMSMLVTSLIQMLSCYILKRCYIIRHIRQCGYCSHLIRSHVLLVGVVSDANEYWHDLNRPSLLRKRLLLLLLFIYT